MSCLSSASVSNWEEGVQGKTKHLRFLSLTPCWMMQVLESLNVKSPSGKISPISLQASSWFPLQTLTKREQHLPAQQPLPLSSWLLLHIVWTPESSMRIMLVKWSKKKGIFWFYLSQKFSPCMDEDLIHSLQENQCGIGAALFPSFVLGYSQPHCQMTPPSCGQLHPTAVWKDAFHRNIMQRNWNTKHIFCTKKSRINQFLQVRPLIAAFRLDESVRISSLFPSKSFPIAMAHPTALDTSHLPAGPPSLQRLFPQGNSADPQLVD